ncbi:hypothetical protein ACLKA6_004882 [Drosophila palustris]
MSAKKAETQLRLRFVHAGGHQHQHQFKGQERKGEEAVHTCGLRVLVLYALCGTVSAFKWHIVRPIDSHSSGIPAPSCSPSLSP